jgi:hypothetical protein
MGCCKGVLWALVLVLVLWERVWGCRGVRCAYTHGHCSLLWEAARCAVICTGGMAAIVGLGSKRRGHGLLHRSVVGVGVV